MASKRVDEARQQARLALGKDQNCEAYDGGGARPSPAVTERPITWMKPDPDSMPVLTRGEAAKRLGLRLHQFRALEERGEIATVPTGLTRMVPFSEVVRLKKEREPKG